MPRGKGKGKSPKNEEEPVSSPVQEEEDEGRHDGNPESVEEFLPKPQVEWFSMIIKNQVKKAIPEFLVQLQTELEKNFEEKLELLKTENHKLKEEVATCKQEIEKLRYSKDGINRALSKKSSEIDKLKQTIDNIDQKQREARVRIVGIPEEEGENLEKKLLKLGKNALGLKKLKATDVKSIHRSGKKKETKCRDVIVQFADKEIKDNFQKEKKKLSTCDNPQKRIFINDDLTEYRQKLLYSSLATGRCNH